MADTYPALVGLVLAAGRSRRMGQPKQLLPWREAGTTVVAAAYDSIALFCRHMIVTLGAESDLVRAALSPRSFERAPCDPDAPMIESLREGLRRARRHDASAAVLLLPGDNPGVRTETVRAVCDAGSNARGIAIMPERDGKGGHPALIPPELFDLILGAECDQGLRNFWAAHPDLRARIPIDDPACGRDLDTPEDYANALREIRGS